VRIRDLSEQEMEEISQKYGLREGFGVVIVEVMKETPAEASGLKNGDLVVAFRDRPVVDTRTLQRLVASTSDGETVPLTVLRRDAGRRGVAVVDPVAGSHAAEFAISRASRRKARRRAPAGRPLSAPHTEPGRRLQVGDVLVEVNGRPAAGLRAAAAGLVPRAAAVAHGPTGFRARAFAAQDTVPVTHNQRR
jgi:serine protease Do